MRNKLREILEACINGYIYVEELRVRQGKYLGRLNYIIKTEDMEIIYSTIPHSIFPSYIVMNGEKLHDIEEEKEWFIEAWLGLADEMEWESEMVENVI